MSEVRKVTVNLPQDQIAFLQTSAARDHVSVTEVLRRAINAERFFDDNEQQGKRVLVEKGGKYTEVIRR